MPEESIIETATAPATETGNLNQPLELKVSEMPAASSDRSTAPAKKGSAKESIFAELRKKFSGEEVATASEAAESQPDDAESQEAQEEKPKVSEQKPVEKKKVSPWKMVEEYKAKIKEYEAKLAQVGSKEPAPEKLKEYEEKLTSAEKRRMELEQEIQFVNFQKSEKFQKEYQQPYESAWAKAMTDMSEITVLDGDSERALEAKDVLELVNMPLREAKALAEEKFGDFANEVMSHRKDIRTLFEKQTQAIEAAKKEGLEHFQKQAEAQKQEYGKVTEEIKKVWADANQSAVADEKYGSYFKPSDGDTEGNQRLAKGFELADRAFSENPLAPGLTPEQRRSIVQRHAAVRNRCAAFGRLAYQVSNYQKQISELNQKLKSYQSSEPETGGSKPAAAGSKGRGSAWDSIRADLAKRAR
jgi:hypothetical protein